ncbi:Shal, partial [Symbiodinium pilosum]
APPDPSRLGVRNPNFVSRALRAPWGPLPYAVATEEVLAEPVVELMVVVCVLLSSLLVALETLPILAQPGWEDMRILLAALENGICMVFMIEFACRWYSRSLRPTYILKPLVIIDILAFTPLLLRLMGITESDTMAAVIAGVRLLRVFRLQRFLQDYDGFLTLATQGLGIDPKYVTPVQLEVTRVLLSVFTLLYTATGAIYAAEHELNPQFPDFFTALYFGLTTLTTVGFGDITPITVQGRLVVAASILAGVAVIPYQLSRLAEVFMASTSFDRRGLTFSSIQDVQDSSDRQCPNCKASPHRKDAAFCWRCGEVMPVE